MQDRNAVTFEESKAETEESSRLTEKQVKIDDAIDTVEKSRSRFSKRDQLRVDKVRMLQHVAAFLEDITTLHAIQTNSLHNNPISKREMHACNDIMGRRKHISQGKRTIRSYNPINVDHYLI